MSFLRGFFIGTNLLPLIYQIIFGYWVWALVSLAIISGLLYFEFKEVK